MLQDSANSWKAFFSSYSLWSIFLIKRSQNAQRSGSQLVRGQVNVADETKLCSPIRFTLLCDGWSGVVMEKNWALSVDQCRLQALQFLVHLIDLLSKLLRCNGFTEIQKVVVDQMGSSPSNSDHDFSLSKFGFGKCSGASFLSSH